METSVNFDIYKILWTVWQHQRQPFSFVLQDVDEIPLSSDCRHVWMVYAHNVSIYTSTTQTHVQIYMVGSGGDSKHIFSSKSFHFIFLNSIQVEVNNVQRYIPFSAAIDLLASFSKQLLALTTLNGRKQTIAHRPTNTVVSLRLRIQNW